MKIERIPSIGAKIYSLAASKTLILRDFYEEIAKDISSEISSGRILDVGTGPGYLPIEIAKRTQNIEIIGVDISPTMVEIANRNVANASLSHRIKFQLANASNLPFENNYFDLIVSTFSFHHWSKPVECLKEIYRVLKENGKAWIYDIRRDTSKEVNAQFRRKYGWLLSFFFLNCGY